MRMSSGRFLLGGGGVLLLVVLAIGGYPSLPVAIGQTPAPRVIAVGPGREYTVPSRAAAVAKDGDIVEIDAGLYTGDVAYWSANRLTIRGVGGRAHLEAGGKSAGQKAIWVIIGKETTIENIEFSGCRVPDKNGAGIRQEGAGLTLRNCYFHDNEDGILTSASPDSDILIEGCEFGHNGFGDGYSHNMYIGHVRSFTLQNSYSHHARIGHLVKSRADNNFLLYNRLMDEQDGRSSYVIDLPNGGRSFIIGNVIQHGPLAENGTAVSYAAEGGKNPVQELYVVNNTFVNERPRGKFLRTVGTPTVRVINNLFTGSTAVLNGPGEQTNNLVTDAPNFVDPAHYDYHLTAKSPGIHTGVAPGMAGTVPLRPVFQYCHPLGKESRASTGQLDVGAYQYAGR